MPIALVWFLFSALLIIGLYGIIIVKPIIRDDRMLFLGFCIPMIYWLCDRLFKFISIKLHGRDFILFLRQSDEIDDQLGAENAHVDITDKLFSFGLLIIIVLSLIIGMQLI